MAPWASSTDALSPVPPMSMASVVGPSGGVDMRPKSPPPGRFFVTAAGVAGLTTVPEVSFGGLLVVAAIAFLAPLLIGLFPRARVPAVVLEIVAGIAVGPSGFGWVKVDLPIQILSLMGLAFLLFLAGLEIDLARLRGRLLRLAGGGFLVTLALGLVCGLVFGAAGLV